MENAWTSATYLEGAVLEGFCLPRTNVSQSNQNYKVKLYSPHWLDKEDLL